MVKKIKVGIIGASGFTAQELTAILACDKYVEIEFLHSVSSVGQKSKFIDLKFENLSDKEMVERGVDLIFFATPNGVASKKVRYFLDKDIKIIDLSADFRFKDTKIFEEVYKIKHVLPKNKAVFGLTEIFQDKLKNASLVANPGCYVTSCLLAAWPIKTKFALAVFDAKSGFSGAGKKFSMQEEIKENIIPYKISDHRHQSEIQQFLNKPIFFTPHLLNTFRGLESTCHFILKAKYRKLNFYKIFCDFYKNFPHVKVQKQIPNLLDAKGTNNCVLGGFELDKNGRLVVISVLDNLRKGAASQAVQNLHAIYGLHEKIVCLI